MIIAKYLALISFLFLFIKIYYSIRLGSKKNISSFAKLIGGVYGAAVIFPILRKPFDNKEKAIIKRANIAVGLFWFFFLLTMISILLV